VIDSNRDVADVPFQLHERTQIGQSFCTWA
jgi:hypothetical protein